MGANSAQWRKASGLERLIVARKLRIHGQAKWGQALSPCFRQEGSASTAFEPETIKPL